jgi:hypothetical protein
LGLVIGERSSWGHGYGTEATRMVMMGILRSEWTPLTLPPARPEAVKG